MPEGVKWEWDSQSRSPARGSLARRSRPHTPANDSECFGPKSGTDATAGCAFRAKLYFRELSLCRASIEFVFCPIAARFIALKSLLLSKSRLMILSNGL